MSVKSVKKTVAQRPAKRRSHALPAGKALKKLLQTFGVEQLRPRQKEVIDNVLRGDDTLAIMVEYAQSGGCRWKLLTEYFQEEVLEHCGKCDNCLHPPAMALRDRVCAARDGGTANPGSAGKYR